MQEVSFTKIKKVFLFFVFCLITNVILTAQNFYWENPVAITKTDSRFPVSISQNSKSYVFWEEIDTSKKQIYISCRKYDDFNNFSENLRFAGPYLYSGDEVPDIFTVAINKKGVISVAIMEDKGQITIFTSKDEGNSFTKKNMATSSSVMVAPRIYVTKNDGFKIFTSVGEENSFSIFYSDSNDGENWSKFSQFQPAQNYRNPFIPVRFCRSIL